MGKDSVDATRVEPLSGVGDTTGSETLGISEDAGGWSDAESVELHDAVTIDRSRTKEAVRAVILV